MSAMHIFIALGVMAFVALLCIAIGVGLTVWYEDRQKARMDKEIKSEWRIKR